MTHIQSNKMATYLRQKREKAGLTQLQVSKKLGFSTPQFVSNWERAMCAPPLDVLSKLKKLYSLDPDEVIELCLLPLKIKLQKALRTGA